MVLSRSDVVAEYIETRSDGAVFRFFADPSLAIAPEEVREISRGALDVVDIFCNRVIDGIEKPIVNWDGSGNFEEWPCEGEFMIHKYSGLGGDWNNMAVIISDRYLATCFREVFCRACFYPMAIHAW
jgi:hypothetical protein